MAWTPPKRIPLPWIKTFANLLTRVPLPSLQCKSLWIASDFSLTNRASAFDVIGLLIADANGLADWDNLRRRVRSKHLGDVRTLSWKKLKSDSRRNAAFLPFLRAADFIPGFAVTLAFHKNPAFQIPPESLSQLQKALGLSAEWKGPDFEHVFKIAYCAATLVAGISSPNQDIYWVSDKDAAFINAQRSRETLTVFAKLLSLLSSHKLGQVHYGTTACTREDLFEEDLVAIPDLMCGATCEILTAIKNEYVEIPDIYAQMPKLDARAQSLLNWYSSGPFPLRRYICSFEHRKGRPSSVGILQPGLMRTLPILVSTAEQSAAADRGNRYCFARA